MMSGSGDYDDAFAASPGDEMFTGHILNERGLESPPEIVNFSTGGDDTEQNARMPRPENFGESGGNAGFYTSPIATGHASGPTGGSGGSGGGDPTEYSVDISNRSGSPPVSSHSPAKRLDDPLGFQSSSAGYQPAPFELSDPSGSDIFGTFAQQNEVGAAQNDILDLNNDFSSGAAGGYAPPSLPGDAAFLWSSGADADFEVKEAPAVKQSANRSGSPRALPNGDASKASSAKESRPSGKQSQLSSTNTSARNSLTQTSIRGALLNAAMLPNGPLRAWEEEHEKHLEFKRQEEVQQRDLQRADAAAALKAWYERRAEKIAERKAANVQNETTAQQGAQSIAGPTETLDAKESWGKVWSLIAASSNSKPAAGTAKLAANASSPPAATAPQTTLVVKDATRMKSLLQQLKSHGPAEAITSRTSSTLDATR